MTDESNAPIRMGVAGLGRAGWSNHVAAIRDRDDYILTDVVDPDEERLAEAQAEFECCIYQDYNQFLDRSDAELIVVATQSRDHAEHAIRALQAGKHVLVEKPMATTTADVDRIITQAAGSGRLLTVYQNSRLRPDYLHIREVMQSGVLGRVFTIKRGSYYFVRRNDWQVLRKYGGGQLNNKAVHLIDQVVQLLDSPVKDVWGDLQQILNPGDVEDHAKVVLRTQDGTVADIEVTSVCALSPPDWVLMGRRGTLISAGGKSRLRYVADERLPELVPVDAPAAADRRYGADETISFIEREEPASSGERRSFYDYLYESLRGGRPLLVTPESVRRTMEVVERARMGTPFA
jgi:predicted dehydrogenase